MNNSHGGLMDKINESGDWNDDLKAEMKKAVDDFKATGSW
jgi:F-type H+-transporting ATPase subunit alpha